MRSHRRSSSLVAHRARDSFALLASRYDSLGDLGPLSRRAFDVVRGHIPTSIRTVCDLGCGTGRTAIRLARSGLTVYAVDASPAMCSEAARNAVTAGQSIDVRVADAVSLQLPEPVDLIVCEFYPLNYLRRRSDLLRAFRRIASQLRPEGHFYFDLSERAALEAADGMVHCWSRPEFTLTQSTRYIHRRRAARLQLTWVFAQTRSSNKETHLLVSWTRREVGDAVQRAGMKLVRTWDGSQIRSSSIRKGFETHYLARKR